MKIILFALGFILGFVIGSEPAEAASCSQKFQTKCQIQWTEMLAGNGADAYHKCLADNREEFGRSCRKMVDLTVTAHEEVAAGNTVRYPGEYRVKRAYRELDRYDKRARGVAGRRYWK